MKFIYNNIIPFKGYKALCIGNLCFVRKNAVMYYYNIRHEMIHSLQWKECLYIFFLPIYILSFVWQFLKRWKWDDAYRNVCFECEAYAHAHEADYLEKRKPFAWLKKQNS